MMRFFRIAMGAIRPKSRLGQVIIPALFFFPTFMLFVYLLYETAKLSREKIRHQFAIDAAVFVEMTNYSDFLNRSAYVNGAFPMRIFDEGFQSTKIDCDQKADCQGPKSLFWIMCKRGDFPVRGGDCGDGSGSPQRPFDRETQWDIAFGGDGAGKNSPNPSVGGQLEILTMDDANHFWINWDDANQVYKLYVQIYQLLGSVEDAQYSVLTRLAGSGGSGHNFLRKSYWLNTGDSINDAAAAAALFDVGVGNWSLGGGGVKYHCYRTLNFYGNKPTGSMFQPWQVYAPQTPPTMPSTIQGCDGLFHLLTVSSSLTSNLKKAVTASQFMSRGVPVNQVWTAPSNYFNVNFNVNPYMPQGRPPAVHVSVAIDGFGGAKAAVWPSPTPKFQVRTYP